MSSPPEDRLSEAKSAYTVRGGDAVDLGKLLGSEGGGEGGSCKQDGSE